MLNKNLKRGLWLGLFCLMCFGLWWISGDPDRKIIPNNPGRAAPPQVVDSPPTDWQPPKFVPFRTKKGELVTATGPLFPASVSNDALFGSTAWTLPGNAAADDAADATIVNNDSDSQYLKGLNYAPALGSDQIIDGIEVIVNRKCTGGCIDRSVKLVIGGVIVGSDRSAAAAWTGSYASVTFGGPTDKWGLSDILYSEVNASNFGAVFASAMSDVVDTASVDFISVIIYHHTGSIVDAVGTTDTPASGWWFSE